VGEFFGAPAGGNSASMSVSQSGSLNHGARTVENGKLNKYGGEKKGPSGRAREGERKGRREKTRNKAHRGASGRHVDRKRQWKHKRKKRKDIAEHVHRRTSKIPWELGTYEKRDHLRKKKRKEKEKEEKEEKKTGSPANALLTMHSPVLQKGPNQDGEGQFPPVKRVSKGKRKG